MDEALKRFKIIELYLSKEQSLTSIAVENNLNLRTLQRWVLQYTQFGIDGLMRKRRADKGSHHKINAELKSLIEGLALHKQKMSIVTMTRKINEYCAKNNLPPIDYHMVRKLIKNIPDDMMLLAKQGDKAYADTYELIMRRESQYPNEIWQADHTMLNIDIIGAKGQKVRPWLTVIMDDFSRAIAGYCLFIGAPSALQTALALRQAIWYKQDEKWPICGIPETLYTDHGSDFTSTHIEYLCIDLKIQLIHSTVGKPRGRGKIERFFSSLEQQLLEPLKWNNKSLALSELEALIHEFIVHHYHYSIHGTTNEMPVTLWNQAQFIPHMPESLEKLNLLFLSSNKTRMVQRDGIQFAGLRYFHQNLAAYVGESVVIRYDPKDLAEVWVYHDDKLVCKAICEKLQDETISFEDLKKVRVNRKKALKKEIKSKTSLAEQLLLENAKGDTVKNNADDRRPNTSKQRKFKLYENE